MLRTILWLHWLPLYIHAGLFIIDPVGHWPYWHGLAVLQLTVVFDFVWPKWRSRFSMSSSVYVAGLIGTGPPDADHLQCDLTFTCMAVVLAWP